MRFEARELNAYAEPVTAGVLRIGDIYFSLHFVDGEMLVPELEPLVFIGRDLMPGDDGMLYFQDAGSHHHGIRFESSDAEEADIYAQPENAIKHIFDFDGALDVRLMCSIRRQEHAR